MKLSLQSLVKKIVSIFKRRGRFYFLDKNVIEVNNLAELMKIWGWKTPPELARDDIYDFDYIEDINERRIRDAESLALVMKNSNPKIALEIGTAQGQGTALMAINCPSCKIYTMNIPPEEILSGTGGDYTTMALEIEKIGIEYKKKNLKNIEQIYANSATWQPNIGTIDLAFIDGCHDTDFVFNDTKKILKHCNGGGYILWHDFNPSLVNKFDWINAVCLGVEKLYRKKLLHGRIYHLKDSWVGIYKV